MPIVTELWLYPIKSCTGIAIPSATLTAAGLQAHGVGDREWMLVTPEGVFLTQRELPRMALISPSIENTELVVNAPGMPSLRVGIHSTNHPSREVTLWEELHLAADMGDAAAQWFSQFLQTPCCMVRALPSMQRTPNPKWTGGRAASSLFSDGYPLLLISQASLDDLNDKLHTLGRSALPMNRFRPNIVIDGIAAFEEDYVDTFSFGGETDTVQLAPVKPCPRCPIPSVDQDTGIVGDSPLDVLQTYRANPLVDGGITIGMNVIVVNGVGKTLQVGAEAEVELKFD